MKFLSLALLIVLPISSYAAEQNMECKVSSTNRKDALTVAYKSPAVLDGRTFYIAVLEGGNLIQMNVRQPDAVVEGKIVQRGFTLGSGGRMNPNATADYYIGSMALAYTDDAGESAHVDFYCEAKIVKR